MQHPQTRKKNIMTILGFFKELAANGKQFLSPPKVTIWTLQDARDADGVTLKMTFPLVHKKGHESTARVSYLHSHKDSVFTGEKKRGIKRGRKRSCWVPKGSWVRRKFESLWTGFLANLWRKWGEGEMKEKRKERFCRAVNLHIFCLLHGWWKFKKVIWQKKRWQLEMLSKWKLQNMRDLEAWG